MQLYKNLNGNSSVHAFEISGESIVVVFKGGRTYRYTYGATGSSNIERMKILAIAGEGLGASINRYVRKKYAKRLK